MGLDAVLWAKGIDMVQFGASDYAMSIGEQGSAINPTCGKPS